MVADEEPLTGIRCRACGHRVPGDSYCIRCGTSLAEAAGIEGPALARRPAEYAAAPGEPVVAVRIASTLFPQLPRSHMEPFRWALAIATLAIVVPASLRLFPVALIIATVAVPLVMVVYLYVVNVYEDEPVRVVALTAVWGVIAGLLTSLLANALSPANPLAEGATTWITAGRAVLLPLIGAALAVLGPVALLVYHKFNDVLDGTTFGAVTGAWFVGAQSIGTGVDLLSSGIRPSGDATEWVLRLLAQGVVMPIMWGATLGALMGTLWLRFRAPVRDRAALPAIDQPILALLLAAIVLVAAAASQVLLPEPLSLGFLVLLAVPVVIWLRVTVHAGLLQVSDEGDVGPSVVCANCGRLTPVHSYCASCGVALRALPKTTSGVGRALT